MKRSVAIYYLLFLIVTILLSIHLMPPFEIIGHDKQVFVYSGMAIWKGLVPYKDFFDHKPPIIFLISTIAWHFGAYGYFIIGVITKWVASIAIFKTAVKLKAPVPVIYPVLFLIMLLPAFVLSESPLTREYAACFLAILLSHIIRSEGSAFILSGILAALVFHTQQEELFWALPFLTWQILQTKEKHFSAIIKSAYQNASYLITGFIIATIPFLIYFTLTNTLKGYWNVSMVFNLKIYGSDKSLGEKIYALFFVLFHTRFLLFLAPIFVTHLYLLWKKAGPIHVVFLASILAGLTVKIFFGRITDLTGVYHYTLSLSAVLAYSMMFCFSAINLSWVKPFLKPLALVFVLMYFVVFWKNSFPRIKRMINKEYNQDVKILLDSLQELKNKDGQLYAMGFTPHLYLNNQLNCSSPSPWIYVSQYNQELPFDRNAEVIQDICNSLDKHKTKYIVDHLLILPLKRSMHQKLWVDYLNKNYKEVKRTDTYVLLKRN